MSLVQARISRSALLHNLELIQHHAGDSKVWAVVKANAYGHSTALVVPEILPHVNGLACARICEAVDLRAMTVQLKSPRFPILVLGGCYTVESFLLAQSQYFQVVVHTFEQLETLQKTTQHASFGLDGLTLKVWFKLNVGMNRLGFPILRAKTVLAQLNSLPGVQLCGVIAHLGTADEPNHPETQRQMQACIEVFTQLKKQMPELATSLSNSAHLFAQSQQQIGFYPWHKQSTDWVRPGISLYGASPFSHIHAPTLGLKPVMHLQAQIVVVRDLLAGESVGYGATWTAPVPVRLFVVACGYGDGYPRHIENGYACWSGLELYQAGRVSMDFTLFYRSMETFKDRPTPIVGEYVELWGEEVLVDEIAKRSKTIGYERLTQISQRVAYSLVE